MRTLRFVFAAALAASCVLAACSNPNDSSQSAFDAFAAEYCTLTAPCCTDVGKDPASCTSALRELAAILGATYDAARGDACLVKLRAAQACDFTDAQASCKGVIGAQGSTQGTKQPGAACTSASDCAPSADGPVTCAFGSVSGASGSSSTVELCQVQASGALGGPCDGDLRVDGSRIDTSASSGSPPAVAHYCEQAAGLTCDGVTKTCATLIADGGACATSQLCMSQSCQLGKCASLVPVGGDCSAGPCVAGAYCNGGTCAMKLATGAPCSPSGSNTCVGFCDAQKMTCVSGGFSSPPIGCFSQGGAK